MFESRSERLIREAMDRGDFEDLPGHGKPLPGAGKPYDPNWWMTSLLDRERADDERRRRYQRLEMRVGALMSARSETSVRISVARINHEIAELNDAGTDRYEPFDIEDVVSAWRSAHRMRNRSAPGGMFG